MTRVWICEAKASRKRAAVSRRKSGESKADGARALTGDERISIPRGGGPQAQERDLGRDSEAVRRAPPAGARVHVDPEAPVAAQAARVPVREADEQAEREELAAVRVSRELEVVAGGLGRARGVGAVREQELEARALGARDLAAV